MKKSYFLILALFVFSCSVEVTTEETSTTDERETIDLSKSSDILTLNKLDLDILFFGASNISSFLGIKDGEEIKVPVTLDFDFELQEDSYGYYSNIKNVYYLNEKYDLIEGSVTKFLNNQSIVKGGTTFNIIGFRETTEGEYLILDKENLDFKELEEGFDINPLWPIQLIGNKLYYIKNIQGGAQSDIKYMDLNNIAAPPVLHHSSEYISSFLINAEMDFFIRLGGTLGTRFLSNGNSVEQEPEHGSEPLLNHFVGLDGKFYAQYYTPTVNTFLRGFHTIDVNLESVLQTEVLFYDSNSFSNFYLGKSEIVIPNPLRNTNLIISQSLGPTTLYLYEFSTNPGEISAVDIEITISSFPYVDYYNNDYFIIRDTYASSSERRLRKFDFQNYNSQAEVSLGDSDNGILFNHNNGSIYCLKTQHGQNARLLEIRSDNTIKEVELSYPVRGLFSVIE